jgi:uracil-DNA glycosylase
VTSEEARQELAALTRALQAHLEWQANTGATGLDRATAALAAERRARSGDLPVSEDGRPPDPPDSGAAAPNAPLSSPSGDRQPPPASPPGAPGPGPLAPSVPHAAAPSSAASARQLEVLVDTVRGCTRCSLHQGRTQTVFARGTGSSGLCFVGEGPGADEDAQGLPFVGKAGQLLDRMIAAMGFERDEVYVCNIVKCRPPQNRKPEPSEMAACRPHLEEQLALVQPQVIVALGATAVEGLLGIGGGITRLRGTWRLYQGRIPVMPTFHPAYLLRTPSAKRDVWSDLQQVLQHLGRPLPERERSPG